MQRSLILVVLAAFLAGCVYPMNARGHYGEGLQTGTTEVGDGVARGRTVTGSNWVPPP